MGRITGGIFKGTPLVAPEHIRATPAKVRQAAFNILGSFVEGARVLDAFAGSGSFGLEALSRGAAYVAFIESDAQAAIAIRDNLARLSPTISRDAWRLLQLDVRRGLRELADSSRPFDIVFFDPPYGTDEGKKALNALVEYAILAPAGIVILEHYRRLVLPASIGPLRQGKEHRYGDTVLSLYQPVSPAGSPARPDTA